MTLSRANLTGCAAERFYSRVTRQSSGAFAPTPVRVRKFFQQEKNIEIRIERVRFRRFYNIVSHGAGLCAAGRIGEQKVLASHDKRLDTPFGAVIADFKASVQKIIRQGRPLVVQIGERAVSEYC